MMALCNDTLSVWQVIGLVENQSDWYLGKLWKNHQPWPALVSQYCYLIYCMFINVRMLGWATGKLPLKWRERFIYIYRMIHCSV